MHRSCGPTHLETPKPDVPGNEICITPGQHHLLVPWTQSLRTWAISALSTLFRTRIRTASRPPSAVWAEGLILHCLCPAFLWKHAHLNSGTATFVQGCRAGGSSERGRAGFQVYFLWQLPLGHNVTPFAQLGGR